MLLAGSLANRIDSRHMLAFGFVVLGVSTFMLGHVNLEISMLTVAVPNFFNGFAGGFIFVPLTTMAMSRLRKQEIGNAAGIYNLVRNIGGSIGIATATTLLVRRAQVHQNFLAAGFSASGSASGFVQGLQGSLYTSGTSTYDAQQKAFGAIYILLKQQASLLAYVDNFRILGFLSFICIPFVFLFRTNQKAR
jgi:DHA2 family multidrug resistance protein